MSTVDWRRAAGIGFGLATHALFGVTVWLLFWFLKESQPGTGRWALGWDTLLALQFAAVHSLLLLPATRGRLKRWIAPAFYGCFYCTATCLGLLVVFAGWRHSPVVLWNLGSPLHEVVELCFYASWAALVYSLSLTGLGYQTGLTPWLAWLRNQPQPRRDFAPKGAYRFMRHPVYLSFLGLVWFTPTMTLDRAVLTAVWTTYIFIGSYLKDERLAHYLGEAYRAYQSQVPGYPLFVGPLGRLRRVPAAPVDSAPRQRAA